MPVALVAVLTVLAVVACFGVEELDGLFRNLLCPHFHKAIDGMLGANDSSLQYTLGIAQLFVSR